MHRTAAAPLPACPSIPMLTELSTASGWELTPDGIIQSLPVKDFVYDAWLDLPAKDEFREALTQGVAHVLDRYAKNRDAAQYVRDNIYDLSRAGWQAACPIRRDSLVLDVGCGLGALSRSLARNCGNVVGMDACYQRLMVHGAVNRELNYDNITLLCGTHATVSEFPDASFDGIVLNGILEWIPEMADGEPGEIQAAFLRQCRRILKEGGWLYLGIENRWGFRYFLDRPEDHADLMYASLLPRTLANLWTRRMRKKPYRTYTYGPAGYAQLMAAAGFGATSIYGTLPDYRNFNILRPLSQTRRAHGAASHLGITKRWKQWIVETPSFFRRFVPTVGVVAHRDHQPRQPAWFDDWNTIGRGIEQLYVKHDQASVWYTDMNRQDRIREVALSPAAVSKLQRVAGLAEGLRQEPEMPISLADWRLEGRDGYVWADRRKVTGMTLDKLSPPERAACLPRVWDALRRLHAASRSLNWKAEGLADLLEDLIPVEEKVGDAAAMDGLRRVASYLDKHWHGIRILMHGDCTPNNVVVAGPEIQLIDWEWSRVVNHPGYDVLKLLWYDDENPLRNPRAWSESTFRARQGEDESRRAFEVVHPGADWPMGVMTYWMVRTYRELGMFVNAGLPHDWVKRIVRPSVDAACALLNL